MLPFS